jgi:hypothetical protein
VTCQAQANYMEVAGTLKPRIWGAGQRPEGEGRQFVASGWRLPTPRR